jgi:hypothetical protein
VGEGVEVPVGVGDGDGDGDGGEAVGEAVGVPEVVGVGVGAPVPVGAVEVGVGSAEAEGVGEAAPPGPGPSSPQPASAAAVAIVAIAVKHEVRVMAADDTMGASASVQRRGDRRAQACRTGRSRPCVAHLRAAVDSDPGGVACVGRARRAGRAAVGPSRGPPRTAPRGDAVNKQLSRDDVLRLCRVLAHMVACDGDMNAGEERFLEMAAVRYGLDDEEVMVLQRDLARGHGLDVILDGLSDVVVRRFIYQQALLAALADGLLRRPEEAELDRLRGLLDLPDPDARRIEAWVVEGLEWQREGRQILGLEPAMLME